MAKAKKATGSDESVAAFDVAVEFHSFAYAEEWITGNLVAMESAGTTAEEWLAEVLSTAMESVMSSTLEVAEKMAAIANWNTLADVVDKARKVAERRAANAEAYAQWESDKADFTRRKEALLNALNQLDLFWSEPLPRWDSGTPRKDIVGSGENHAHGARADSVTQAGVVGQRFRELTEGFVDYGFRQERANGGVKRTATTYIHAKFWRRKRLKEASDSLLDGLQLSNNSGYNGKAAVLGNVTVATEFVGVDSVALIQSMIETVTEQNALADKGVLNAATAAIGRANRAACTIDNFESLGMTHDGKGVIVQVFDISGDKSVTATVLDNKVVVVEAPVEDGDNE